MLRGAARQYCAARHLSLMPFSCASALRYFLFFIFLHLRHYTRAAGALLRGLREWRYFSPARRCFHADDILLFRSMIFFSSIFFFFADIYWYAIMREARQQSAFADATMLTLFSSLMLPLFLSPWIDYFHFFLFFFFLSLHFDYICVRVCAPSMLMIFRYFHWCWYFHDFDIDFIMLLDFHISMRVHYSTPADYFAADAFARVAAAFHAFHLRELYVLRHTILLFELRMPAECSARDSIIICAAFSLWLFAALCRLYLIHIFAISLLLSSALPAFTIFTSCACLIDIHWLLRHFSLLHFRFRLLLLAASLIIFITCIIICAIRRYVGYWCIIPNFRFIFFSDLHFRLIDYHSSLFFAAYLLSLSYAFIIFA